MLLAIKLIVRAGTGLEKIDCEAVRKRNIEVVNLPGYAAVPVGQATLGFILLFAGSVPQYNHEVKVNKEWRGAQFKFPQIILKNKKLGIIGLGAIARYVIELAQKLEMDISVFTRYPDPSLPVSYTDIDEIASISDFITIHCALDNRTQGLVNDNFLSKVKPTCYIINTARPSVIDENSIIEAIYNKKIAGLALDGFWREPSEKEHPLFIKENVIITPHITWSPLEIRQSMIVKIGRMIERFLIEKSNCVSN